jgi:hypothetical protein
MTTLLKKAGLGAALAATALTGLASPAEAQRYYHRGGHGDAAGAALVGGIAGLAIGAAIASNGRDRDRDVYYRERGYAPDYDYSYYRGHGYYPADGYYAYHYRGYGHCWTEPRWDPYWHRRVPIRVCR